MSCIIAAVVWVLFIVADQITKYIVTVNMTLGESRPFLKGLIDFVYIYNEGGAWGFLKGQQWILLTITSVIIIVFITVLIKYGMSDKVLFWSICLVLSGGLGNMIDRLFRDGKVVDFLHFEFMPNFPVFNVADCAVVIGTGLLILYFVLETVKENKEKKNSLIKAEEKTKI
mgnify:CR=1 FL=1